MINNYRRQQTLGLVLALVLAVWLWCAFAAGFPLSVILVIGIRHLILVVSFLAPLSPAQAHFYSFLALALQDVAFLFIASLLALGRVGHGFPAVVLIEIIIWPVLYFYIFVAGFSFHYERGSVL